MKYCGKCGNEINEEDQYCPNCGNRVNDEQVERTENSFQGNNTDKTLWE